MCLFVTSMAGYEVVELARSGANHPRALAIASGGNAGDGGGGGGGGEAGVGGSLLDYVEDEADSLGLETRLWMRVSQGTGLLDLYFNRSYEVRPTGSSDDSILLVRPPKGAGPVLGIRGLRLTLPPPDQPQPASLLTSPANCAELLKQLCFLAGNQPPELSSLSALAAALGCLAATVRYQVATVECRSARLEAEVQQLREAGPPETVLVEAAGEAEAEAMGWEAEEESDDDGRSAAGNSDATLPALDEAEQVRP